MPHKRKLLHCRLSLPLVVLMLPLQALSLLEALCAGWAALSCSRAHARSGLLHTPSLQALLLCQCLNGLPQRLGLTWRLSNQAGGNVTLQRQHVC